MTNKILITYASRAGSTAEIAEAIGKSLTDSGAQVEVLPMQEVKDMSVYEAIVAGSAMRSSKWLPEAMQFLRVHQADLSGKPFAAFLVCMTLAMANGTKDLVPNANDITPTNADGTIPAIPNSDLFYLTGIDQDRAGSRPAPWFNG